MTSKSFLMIDLNLKILANWNIFWGLKWLDMQKTFLLVNATMLYNFCLMQTIFSTFSLGSL